MLEQHDFTHRKFADIVQNDRATSKEPEAPLAAAIRNIDENKGELLTSLASIDIHADRYATDGNLETEVVVFARDVSHAMDLINADESFTEIQKIEATKSLMGDNLDYLSSAVFIVNKNIEDPGDNESYLEYISEKVEVAYDEASDPAELSMYLRAFLTSELSELIDAVRDAAESAEDYPSKSKRIMRAIGHHALDMAKIAAVTGAVILAINKFKK